MKGTTDRGACPPGLAERDRQWSGLTRFLAEAHAGSGRVAAVTGPVACGKTELLHTFAESAQAAFAQVEVAQSGFAQPGLAQDASAEGRAASGPGARGHAEGSYAQDRVGEGRPPAGGLLVATAVCSAAESALPFGVVARLLRTPALHAGQETERLLERARQVADEQGEFDAGTPAAARMLDALCEAVLGAARTGTALIGVEDVRHLDAPSTHWLLYLVRRLGPARVLLVLTDTPAPRAAPSPLHTELGRHPHCRTVELPLLTEQGVAACVAAHGGDAEALSEADRAGIARAGGGNPLLVRALLEDRRTGTAGRDAGRGPEFQKALLGCLERCEGSAAETMRALCVLDGPARPSALARLTRTGSETVTAALAALEETGLLHPGGLPHPAVRDAVLESLSSGERSRLHLAAAELLHAEGAPADDIAAHLLTAGRLEGPALLPVLHEAAQHALRTEKPRTAVRCLELVRDACGDAPSRAAAEVQLARAESRVNPAAAARRLPALAAAVRGGTLDARDAAALAVTLAHHGRTDDAAEALRHARGGTGPDGAPREAAELHAVEMWLACTHPRLARRGPPGAGPPEAGTAGPHVRPLLTSTAALAHVLGQGQAETAVADAEHVLQAARPSDATVWGAEPALLALYTLVYADRLEEARLWCEQLLEDSTRDEQAVAQAYFGAVRGEIALRCGGLTDAHAYARHALTLLPPPAWGVSLGLPLSVLVHAATAMGRHDDAAAHLREPVPEAMFHTRYGLHYLHARGRHYLATGRYYAAAADFLSCRELMTQWGLDVPGLVPWRTCTAETWLRQGGDRDEARRLVNEQLAKLGPGPSRTRGCALRLLAALSSPRNRMQLLAESVAILEERGDQWELARALADQSAAHRELRAHRRAWSVARRAWHVAEACGARELCEELLPSRTRSEGAGSRGSGQRRADGLGALTDAERRAAALAAAGHTNREIAARLCITPSTIEQHLTRVYRKLNVRHRRDLPPALKAYLPDTA